MSANFDEIAGARLIEAVVMQAFIDSLKPEKAREVYNWAKRDMRIIPVYAELFLVSPERIRAKLQENCRRMVIFEKTEADGL